MILFWKVRCLNRSTNQLDDRRFYLDTKTLDPVGRSAVEFVIANRSPKSERMILKFRHLFNEFESIDDLYIEGRDTLSTVGPHDYFEDENCNEITLQEIGRTLIRDPNLVAIPHGAKQHDIDLMFSPQKPLPIDEISLTSDEIRLLGYFSRDLKELLESAFMKDGPGTISASGNIFDPTSNPVLKTAVTDDEIRSFVTIFRRLYMKKEPANLLKATNIFVRAMGDHPIAKWVTGTFNEYDQHLAGTPDLRPFIPPNACTYLQPSG